MSHQRCRTAWRRAPLRSRAKADRSRCARAVQDCLYGPERRTDIDVEKAKVSFSGDNEKLAQEDE